MLDIIHPTRKIRRDAIVLLLKTDIVILIILLFLKFLIFIFCFLFFSQHRPSRRRTNSDGSNLLAEGGSGAGSGAAAGVTGGVDATSAAVIDDEEIANTIRELTASLRLSPSLDSLQVHTQPSLTICSFWPKYFVCFVRGWRLIFSKL